MGALRERAAGHDVSIRSTNRSHVGGHKALATDLQVPGGDSEFPGFRSARRPHRGPEV